MILYTRNYVIICNKNNIMKLKQVLKKTLKNPKYVKLRAFLARFENKTGNCKETNIRNLEFTKHDPINAIFI